MPSTLNDECAEAREYQLDHARAMAELRVRLGDETAGADELRAGVDALSAARGRLTLALGRLAERARAELKPYSRDWQAAVGLQDTAFELSWPAAAMLAAVESSDGCEALYQLSAATFDYCETVGRMGSYFGQLPIL